MIYLSISPIPTTFLKEEIMQLIYLLLFLLLFYKFYFTLLSQVSIKLNLKQKRNWIALLVVLFYRAIIFLQQNLHIYKEKEDRG
jgi:hypothetical protein